LFGHGHVGVVSFDVIVVGRRIGAGWPGRG